MFLVVKNQLDGFYLQKRIKIQKKIKTTKKNEVKSISEKVDNLDNV